MTGLGGASKRPTEPVDLAFRHSATGDLVRADVPAGKRAGRHVGRVAVRSTGSFRVGAADGIPHKFCSLLQRSDGYAY